MEELNELFCGMDDAQFLELLVADQVAESAQTDLRVFQQLIGRQHLLVGIQFGRFVRLNEARFSNIFIEKRASSCPQSLEKSRLFSYPLLMSEGENSQNVKRIFLRKVVI